MKEIVWVLFWVHGVFGCLPGFVGPLCHVCPTDYVCESGTPKACQNGSRAQLGSRACDIMPNPILATEFRRLAPKSWSAPAAQMPDNTAACGCFSAQNELSVVLDAGSRILIAGVAVKGVNGSWVTKFQASHSLDKRTWNPVGGLFSGNSDDASIVQLRFPYVVQARFLKIGVVNYFRYPSLRAAFLEATNTTCPSCFATTSRVVLNSSSCPRLVNMVLVNASSCTYACRRTTYGPNCKPLPRRSTAPPGGAWFSVSRSRPVPVQSRLHNFPDGVSAMEFGSWNGTDIAVQIDGLPWAPWSQKEWRPGFPSSSHWLLLPSPAATRVRVRVLWNESFVLQFDATQPTTHGNRVALYTKSSLATSAWWGLGEGAIEPYHGDSQGVCSVTTNRPAVIVRAGFQAFSTIDDAHAWGARNAHAHAVFETLEACSDNVPDALQRLYLSTELTGVSAYLDEFFRRRSAQNATVFVPTVSRTQVWHVALVFMFQET